MSDAPPPAPDESPSFAPPGHRANGYYPDYAADAIDGLPTWEQAAAVGVSRAQAVSQPSAPGGWRTAGHALWPWGLHGVAETLEVIGLALLMFLLVRSGAQNFIVDGTSMAPTFADGEMLIVNKLAYRTFDVSWLPWTDDEDAWSPFGDGEPEPGDVVVFQYPNDPGRDFIKRVIAVPGQTVEISDGVLYVDGMAQDEPYLAEPPGYRFGPETVPEDAVFVLGDNRNNSFDSHQWGMLDQRYLIGRAELRYWPLNHFGRIDDGNLGAPEVGLADGPGVTPSLSTAR